MLLRRQTILITGATSGIGRALTLALSERGNHIVAVARDMGRLAELQRELPSVSVLQCDLSIKQDVVRLAGELKQRDLKISVLINNAAIQNTPKFTDAEFDFDSIEVEVTTNLTSVIWLIALILPAMQSSCSGAAVINLSSGLALYPKTSSAIYCATKAAIHSLSQSLRYQLAQEGITVHEILLPLVDTPMTEGRGRGKLSPESVAAAIIKNVERGCHEIWLGKAKLLPVLNRISPAITRYILKNN